MMTVDDLYICVIHVTKNHRDNDILSGADPEISKRGGGRSRRGRILRSKVCFDAPSHISYVFVRRVVNKIHIKHTAC